MKKTLRPARRRAVRKPAPLDRASDRRLEALEVSRRELQQARAYARAIVDTVPPLLILDAGLRVKEANESFYKHFRVSPRQTENRLVHRLGNGQWNVPRLRTFLKEILPRHSFFNDFEVTHEFEAIGRRTVLLSGRPVAHLRRILLFIDDITERVESRAALRDSEIRYRRLFEAARDGILILDPKTRKITDANPFMSELLGYARLELLGKELWEIGLLKDEKASRAAFRELQEKHFIRYEDLPLQNEKGERREVEFVSNVYVENQREVIQCNIRDITERKRAEELLRKSEERFHAIFNQAAAGIAQTDSTGRFTLVNQCYCDITGRRPEELLGLRMQDITHPDDLAFNQTLLNKSKEQGRDFVIEKRYLRPDGDIVWVRNSVSRVNHSPANEQYFLAVTQDITERRRAEQALLAAKNEIAGHALDLEQVVAERTGELHETIGELEGFSHTLSHDLRAPLRAMQSFSQFLVDEYGSRLDAQGLDYLHHIMRSAVRLDLLIKDVLSYTRILHSPVSMGPVDLDLLVRDIMETYPNGQPVRPQIEIKGRLPTVVGNEALLTQCVSNLLSNGAKFVSSGTTPHLEVSAEEREESRIRVWFKDNGIGIARENHERIFRLFERIHPATKYEGTGMGLSIVRKAVQRMGAQVGLESVPGQGSNFWIQLAKG